MFITDLHNMADIETCKHALQRTIDKIKLIEQQNFLQKTSTLHLLSNVLLI